MTDYTGSSTPKEVRDLWRTPRAIFNALDREFHFVCDVAASDKNHLCDHYYSEENSALAQDWNIEPMNYVWCNPPYSKIGPWVEQAARHSPRGIGTVMLIPQDQSVGWFKAAIRSATENRIIIGGRIAFINAETEKPVKGNNKGSQLLIWHPFCEQPIATRYVERDFLIKLGEAAKIVEAA